MPVIEATYTDPAPPPGNRPPAIPTSVLPRLNDRPATSTPTVSAVYSDPDADNGAVAFWLYNGAGQVVWADWSPIVSNGAVAAKAITAQPDGWYYVRAIANDGQLWSADWSPPDQRFFIDTRPPNNPSSLTPANGTSIAAPSQATAVYSEPYAWAGHVYFWVTNNPTGANPLVIIKEDWDLRTLGGLNNASGGTATFRVPPLGPGTYRVYAMAYDGLFSSQVGPNTFTVVAPPTSTTVAPTTTTTVAPTTTTTVAPAPTTTTTTTVPPLDPPTDVRATKGFESATITWTRPRSIVTRYKIEFGAECPTCSGTTPTASATSTTITGLTNGSAYAFVVAAFNDTLGQEAAAK